MAARRTLKWLAISSIVGGVACGSEAGAPRRVVAPVAPRPSAPGVAPAAEPTVASRAVDPPSSGEPTAHAPVELPRAEPPVEAPPCPDDPRRDPHQKPDHVVTLVQLSEAMTVVDLGSGDGYFLCRLSRAVGSRGRVVATEIGKQLVRGLEERVAREQLSNVEVIHAPANDVGIAPGRADRILLVNVWHHLPNRKRYAARVARALAPGGKVVIVDFEPESRRSGHGIAPARVLGELAAGGIDGAVVSDDLPGQYVIVGSVRAPSSDARTPP
jgi:predicted methyltransferase